MKVLKRKKCLQLVATCEDFVVVNTINHNHSHFRDYNGAILCMDLYFKRREKPRGDYMRTAVKRLRQ